MSIQDLFYIVAIVFMILAIIGLVIVLVMTSEIYGRLKKIVQTTTDFTTAATESGRQILKQAEDVIPKIVEVLSLTTLVKTFLKEWQQKNKQKR